MTPQDLGKILCNVRHAAGLRQDELAGAANVGVRFIIDLEAGKTTAQIGKVFAVLDALGCRLTVEPPATATQQTRRP